MKNKFINKINLFYRKSVIFTKRLLIVMFTMSVIGWSVYAGSTFVPRTVYADKEVIRLVETSTTPPVMQRIMACESKASQTDKTGQVVVHVNSDKSYDIGIMQINSIWNKKATELGYDLSKQSDNQAFGMWLYQNIGTSPWNSSASCWSK